MWGSHTRLLQGEAAAPSRYVALQNPERLWWFRSDYTPLKRAEVFNHRWVCGRCREGVKPTRPTGSGQGGHLQHPRDTWAASSPVLTPGPGFSTPWWQGRCWQPALPSLGEGAAQLAVGLLLDFCVTGALPGAHPMEHPPAPLLRSGMPGASSTLRLRAKRSPREALNIHLGTSLAPLITGPQFLQIRTLYLIK